MGLMPCAGDEDDGDDLASLAQGLSRECCIVLVSGFESFNVELYKKVCIQEALLMPSAACSLTHEIYLNKFKCSHSAALCYIGRLFRTWSFYMQAARKVKRECPGINVQVFSDRDISDKKGEIEAALQGADLFFGSLLFDYDQVGELIGSTKLLLVPKKSQRQPLPCNCCGDDAVCCRREAVLHSLWVTLAEQACRL